ncbi:hypothetical protein GCO27_05210 [Corynebacterium sp. zg331]|nr:hypothetical protein [Corynebacterium sp. zg331]
MAPPSRFPNRARRCYATQAERRRGEWKEAMNLDSIVAATQGTWNNTEHDILAYLLTHQAEAANASMQQIAQRTYISTSSVMRLAKRLGFSGFAEMKYFIRTSLWEAAERDAPDPVALQQQDLLGTLTHLESTATDPIVQRLYESNTVYCLGTGSSQRLTASEFAKSLMANGKQATVITDLTEMKVSLPMMKANDTLVLVSLGGNNPGLRGNTPGRRPARGPHARGHPAKQQSPGGSLPVERALLRQRAHAPVARGRVLLLHRSQRGPGLSD